MPEPKMQTAYEAVCRMLSEAYCKKTGKMVVCFGGIYFDDIQLEQIEEFSVSELAPKGMKVIEADRSLVFPMMKLNVKYSEKEGHPLHLQMIYPPMEFEELMGREKKFPLIVSSFPCSAISGTGKRCENSNPVFTDLFHSSNNKEEQRRMICRESA